MQTGKGIVMTKGDLRVTEEYRYIPLPMAWLLAERAENETRN